MVQIKPIRDLTIAEPIRRAVEIIAGVSALSMVNTLLNRQSKSSMNPDFHPQRPTWKSRKPRAASRKPLLPPVGPMRQPSIPQTSDSDLLDRLPEALRRFAFENDVIRQYKPSEMILGPGARSGDEVLYIVEGRADLILRDADNEKVEVETLGPGDIFGEVEFFTGSPWPTDAELVAEGHCCILQIPSARFQQFLIEAPDFVIPLIKQLGRRIIRLDRSLFGAKLKRRALHSVISREEHVFPHYIMGDYVRRRVLARLEELAQSDGPVLIIGETGVGKEGLAHAIFQMSRDCNEVFLSVDLQTGRAAATDAGDGRRSAQEDDVTVDQRRLFFGSEETGPDGGSTRTAGYFELCEGGTLLVRGVDQLTRDMQVKLLEAANNQTFKRVGSVHVQRAKVRLIVTTRLQPSEISPNRHPLLFALLDRSVSIPPLRTRRKEIPGLVEKYLNKYGQELHKRIGPVPEPAMRALVNYAWPGNDLELASTLKRALLVSQDGIVRPENIYFGRTKLEGRGKFNLLRFSWIKAAMKSPLYPAVLQSAAAPFFFIMLVILFFGSPDADVNPVAQAAWTLGWPMLIVGTFLWGRFWCSACPVGTISGLVGRLFSFERPLPRFVRNNGSVLLALAVLAVIWVETATDMRSSPYKLGLLLSAMLLSAIVASVVFERHAWCMNLCALGGLVGVLAKTSVVELRADRNVCIAQCSSNECHQGTEDSEGCPYGLAGPKLQSNRLCKLCGLCVKNCPHDAINLNLRIPGQEIMRNRRTDPGTTFLALGMLGGLLCEIGSKTPWFEGLTAHQGLPRVAVFSGLFIAVIFAVNLLFIVTSAVSRGFFHESLRENYARCGPALLPLALTFFAAFHVQYLFASPWLFPDPAGSHVVALVLRDALIWIGAAWALVSLYALGAGSDVSWGKAAAGAVPHTVFVVALALAMQEALSRFVLG